MTQEQKDKYKRLNDRLAELNDLNGKIARLCFYLNETRRGWTATQKIQCLRRLARCTAIKTSWNVGLEKGGTEHITHTGKNIEERMNT